MSVEPSQPLPEPEQKPLKPGKGYGIVALLCGAVAVFPFLSICLLDWFVPMSWLGELTPLNIIIQAHVWLFLVSPVFAIAGYVLGIEGRDTEGQFYASIGRAFSVLYALLLPLFIVYGIFSFRVV